MVHAIVNSEILYLVKSAVLQEKFRALIFRFQFPDNDGIQGDLTHCGATFPRIGKLSERYDLQHSAITDPIEIEAWDSLGPELKVMSYNGLKIIFHQP